MTGVSRRRAGEDGEGADGDGCGRCKSKGNGIDAADGHCGGRLAAGRVGERED